MIKRDETLSGHIGALQVKQMIINLDDESDDECEEEWAIVIIEEQNQREAERESQCEDERESQREDERERKQRLLEEGQVRDRIFPCQSLWDGKASRRRREE